MILVSIVILSYNSEKYIIDLLESCKKQNYRDIELIISDDASSDHTVDIVEKWIAQHGHCFTATTFNKNEINVGVTENLNRAIALANGEWIKPIGADDILADNCIEMMMEVVAKNNQISWYQGQMHLVSENGTSCGEKTNAALEMERVSMLNVSEQYRYFLHQDIKLTPTLFYKKDLFYTVGGGDRRFRNIEDWPIKLHFLRAGYAVGYFPFPIVFYRLRDSASNRVDTVYSIKHLKNRRTIKKKMIYPNIPITEFTYWANEIKNYLKEIIIIHVFHNQKPSERKK